jgi:small subunit ribosomal protein S2
MLTNWRTIRQRVNELDRLERMRDSGEFARITKKEALILQRKMDRLEYLLGGIRKMNAIPDLVFVVDVYREATAIHEANLLQIPVLALVDTNCDPRNIDFIIPSNDDAIRAIKLLVGKMADAVMEGKAMRKEDEFEAMPDKAPMAISDEPELSDEDLLGAATLAKLPSRQMSDEDGDEVEPTGEIEPGGEAELAAEEEEYAAAEVEVEEVIELDEIEEIEEVLEVDAVAETETTETGEEPEAAEEGDQEQEEAA